MRNIKLTIEYDGTAFQGWQVQPGNRRTVQGVIEKALHKIFKQKIRLIGSGRTDSGVHARGQVANFKISSDMPCDEIVRALNANIPEDVAILEAREVADDFHAQYSVKSKTYRYTILNRPARSALDRYTSLHYFHKLNVSVMKEEAKALIGKKDFKSFTASDPSKKQDNTTRTVKSIVIKKSKDGVTVDITADGFLYKMVRNIIGTLLAVGSGQLLKGSVKLILKKKDRSFAHDTAKAHGLCLMKVEY
ncbi:MAG: tRNA pseudouridine(38-40) synthase TruA [Candidatus Omnitrophica bacterium]|nr:tRNA pseudouridine(38-40) synthase TruA [Candidatus Omnitrophota bacterium]